MVCLFFILISLFLASSNVYSAALSSAQYSTLSDVLDTHLNYFLSTIAVTSDGMPLTAYKIGDRARFGYSNPTEWGYLVQAYIAAAERGKITRVDAASRITKTLTTVKALQDNGLQSYNGGLFYPYYTVTDSAGNDVYPYHDSATGIPSMDNSLFYMSLVIVDGWATDNNFTPLSDLSRTIYSKMNFSPFIFADSNTGSTFEALLIDAQTKTLTGKCDIYANEGGLTTMVAYFSGSVDLATYEALTIAQFRSPASWNGITVREADWFNPMFTWGVRPIAGIPIVGTPYSINSMVQTYKSHLAYGNFLHLDYPGFSDAMSQGWAGNYFPPNISGQMTTSINNITPHAFFLPLNVLSDLDQTTLDMTFTKIEGLMNDSANYYYGPDSTYPFGFVVAANPYVNNLTYAGVIPADGKEIFENLSEAYVALSVFNALQQQDKSKEFSCFVMIAPKIPTDIQTVMNYLYPGFCPACYTHSGCGTYSPISVFPTSNGAITCTPVTVSSGGSFACTVSPESGYHLETLLDNSVDVTTQVSGNSYIVTNVTDGHILQATFQQNTSVVKISRENNETWYTTMQSAYDAGSDGDKILVLASDFYENADFNHNISITLQGGYNQDFNAITGWTVMNGELTITAGTVVVEYLFIK